MADAGFFFGGGSGQGFFSPEDQDVLSQIRRKQAYANALLQSETPQGAYGGLASAGNKILGAILANKADTQERDLTSAASQKYAADLSAFLSGIAPSQPQSPSNTGGGVAGSPSPQALGAAITGGPQTPPMQAQSPMDALIATHNPALMQQFGPTLFQNQLDTNNKQRERQWNLEDRKVVPISNDEAASLGLRPGGVYGRDASGNLTTIQASDMKSQGAIQQGLQEKIDEARNVPMTAYQRAELGQQAAQLNKPVAVGFGQQLVDPRTGKVVFGGSQMDGNVPTGKDGQPLTGDSFLSTIPPQFRNQVKALGEYRQAPLTSMALRSPQGSQLSAWVNQYNPTYDASQYGSKVKSRNDFATGKNGNTVRSLNVAVQHLDQLGQLASALDNGNVQLFNRIGQSVSQQTGHPQPTNFDAAKQIVADEVIKAVVGSGGGVHDREEAANTISRASSPKQLAGVIQTYQGLMSGQLAGLKQQYEKTTGLKDFEDYLAPETKLKLEGHGANNSGRRIIKFSDLP